MLLDEKEMSINLVPQRLVSRFLNSGMFGLLPHVNIADWMNVSTQQLSALVYVYSDLDKFNITLTTSSCLV